MITSIQEILFNMEDIRAWAQKPYPLSAKDRLPGVHLSGLIKAKMENDGKVYDQQDFEEEFPLRMAMGMAWENWLVGLREFTEAEWQPKPWVVQHRGENVSGTPDAMLKTGKCVEVKATWKNMKLRATKEDMEEREKGWLIQTCMNAFHYGRTKGELWVGYMVGDWSYPLGPKLVLYELEWTREEQERIWQDLLGFYDRARPEEGSGKWKQEKIGTKKPIKWPKF